MEEKESWAKRNWVYILIFGIVVVISGFSYCKQEVPKTTYETYMENEPYTVQETRTRTQYVEQDGCDARDECNCVDRYLGIFKHGCRGCDCQLTETVPTTKYRQVQKQRAIIVMASRCNI